MTVARIASLLMLLFVVTSITGQSLDDLRARKAKLIREIQSIDQLLQRNEREQMMSYDDLLILNQKYAARKELVYLLTQEISQIDHQIQDHQAMINSLSNDLEELKAEYARMLYHTYKNNNSYSRLMYLFSADNINEAYKRLTYIQQYTDHRKQQAQQIEETRGKIADALESLEQRKSEKGSSLQHKQVEKERLAHQKDRQEALVETLKDRNKELLKDLERKKFRAGRIEKAIAEMLDAEVGTQQLSHNFVSNKGHLPAPIKNGMITGRFGPQHHQVYPDLEIYNNGVDITVQKGAIAQSVFNGVVCKIWVIPGEGKTVLIRHGAYFTSYSYMSALFVSSGDEVVTGQEIGVLVAGKGHARTKLHFELWKGKVPVNPEYWVRFD